MLCSAEAGYIASGSISVEFSKPQIYGDQMVGGESNWWQWGGLQGSIAMKISDILTCVSVMMIVLWIHTCFKTHRTVPEEKKCCCIFISNINKTKINFDKYSVKSCQHRNIIHISLLAAVLKCNCTVVNSVRSVAGAFNSPGQNLAFWSPRL